MDVAEEFNREHAEYGTITMPHVVEEDLLDRVLGVR